MGTVRSAYSCVLMPTSSAAVHSMCSQYVSAFSSHCTSNASSASTSGSQSAEGPEPAAPSGTVRWPTSSLDGSVSIMCFRKSRTKKMQSHACRTGSPVALGLEARCSRSMARRMSDWKLPLDGLLRTISAQKE